MFTQFQWISFLSILCIAFAGGYYPLMRRERARSGRGFPMGQAFAAGVFLALSMLIMLPNGSHLFGKAFPELNYPLGPLAAIFAYLFLLALGHIANVSKSIEGPEDNLTTPAIPIIMTIMIAIPSFLLGTALGISAIAAALLIFLAIMAHKGSAGFALALCMVRSTMSKHQTFALYGLFAFSTPIGILVGADIHQHLSGHAVLVTKATILSLASGVFLYMATLHEMRHAPLIIHCCTPRGFGAMLVGLLVTALVRWMVGMAHTGHSG